LRFTAMYNKDYYRKYRRLKRGYRVSFTLNFAEISEKKPLKILDLGCGVGTYSEACAKEGHSVVSMDISKEALRLSKERGLTNLVRASATHLPFKPCTFDRVLFIDVMEHLRDPAKALLDIRRILAPQGLLTLQTQYPSILGKYLYNKDPTHQKLYTVQELTGLLRSINFMNIHATAGSFLPRLYPFNIILRHLFKTITTIKARR